MAATPPTPPDAMVVLTTVGTADAAATLVTALLAERLVACGTCLPDARSLYHWEGALHDEREVVILLKTTADRLAALEAAFARLHPYDVPELLALPVAHGAAGYLAWLSAATAPSPPTAP
ncbi:MAG: divalent-cation tolerance protein CutA [Gemmatimonadaceae bacterium]|jgi:periplasmic divalent cation tolerance protein|nr:divalent-cation tolerance protein CutA [Gemmatimonadaceae bacterium]